jgi:hypothetical protein
MVHAVAFFGASPPLREEPVLLILSSAEANPRCAGSANAIIRRSARRWNRSAAPAVTAAAFLIDRAAPEHGLPNV